MGSFLTTLKSLWKAWKRIARKIGDFQARVLLNLFYFIFLLPFALIVRWATDPLAIKPGHSRGWRPRPDEQGPSVERAAQQF
jgi:hypothetical protein